MQKKILLLICPILLLCGCGIDYEWDTRLIFEGVVADENGQPLQGIRIFTNVTQGTGSTGMLGSWGNDNDIVSETITDENGYYRMFFPSPQNEEQMLLLINNSRIGSDYSNPFSTTTIYNILKHDLTDHKLDFGEQRLYRVENTTTLQITYEQVNSTSALSNIKLEGLINDKRINYNFTDADFDHSYIGTALISKNQTLILSYSVTSLTPQGEFITTPYEVEIPVGADPVIYTLQY
jgi:hypothetical protein